MALVTALVYTDRPLRKPPWAQAALRGLYEPPGSMRGVQAPDGANLHGGCQALWWRSRATVGSPFIHWHRGRLGEFFVTRLTGSSVLLWMYSDVLFSKTKSVVISIVSSPLATYTRTLFGRGSARLSGGHAPWSSSLGVSYTAGYHRD
jgi:hypothetical protein